jgi:hypothetical protein
MNEAIYCRNGHFLSYAPEGNPDYSGEIVLHEWQIEYVERELKRLAYCSQCGAESIRDCPKCKFSIQIDDEVPERPPSYCSACGKAFPWTETALAAAKEYTDELEQLTAVEKATLKATFDDLTRDTPRTEPAVHRFKKFLKKIGPQMGDALLKMVFSLATDAAKKKIGL